MIEQRRLSALVEIDGGVNLDNFERLADDAPRSSSRGTPSSAARSGEAVRTMRDIAGRKERR
jgi:pentose-5-phosphate-3-epimerase